MSGTPAPLAALGGIAGRAAGAAGFACGAFATFFEAGADFAFVFGAGFLGAARVSFFFGATLLGFERNFDLRVAIPLRFFWFSARLFRAGMDGISSFLAMARKDS
jgi:hypothetical protein